MLEQSHFFKYRKPPTCSGCPLESQSGFIVAEGQANKGVMLIGDNGGKNEAADGQPFRPYAEGGSVLEKVFRMMGSTRHNFAMYNVLGCQPPGNELRGASYEARAIEHCKPHRQAFIKQHAPKVLVALGAVAMRTLTGIEGEVDLLRGFALPGKENPDMLVVPTYHPSYVHRDNWALLDVVRRDIEFATRVAQYGVPRRRQDFRLHCGPSELRELLHWLRANPSVTLYVDFETPYTRASATKDDTVYDWTEENERSNRASFQKPITQVNFGIGNGNAWVCEFNAETMPYVMDICAATPNRKVGHNLWFFDCYIAMYNGFEIRGDVVDDTMWRFHHIQPDLPGTARKSDQANDFDGSLAPLQFVASYYGWPYPWKHLAQIPTEMHRYGAIDCDACAVCDEGTEADLVKYGIKASYMEFCVEYRKVLQEQERRGIGVDPQHFEAFSLDLAKEIQEYHEKIQVLVPEDLKPFKVYKRKPQDMTGVRVTEIHVTDELCGCKFRKAGEADANCVACKGEGKLLAKPSPKGKERWKACPCTKRVVYGLCKTCAGVGSSKEVFMGQDQITPCAVCNGTGRCQTCHGRGSWTGAKEVWARTQPFNVSSPVQMKRYLLGRGYKIPRNRKRVIAMDRETIDALARKYKDPALVATTELRMRAKLKSTYCDSIVRNTINHDPHGSIVESAYGQFRVHPMFGYKPVGGQVSSSPNVQNQPNVAKVRKEYAIRQRKGFVAGRGRVLIAGDFSSFHVATLGYEAGDEDYIRLAHLDPHSYLTAWLLRIPYYEQCLGWDDGALRDYLKWIKKHHETVRNAKAKPSLLGYGLGMGAMTLYLNNLDSFNGPQEAAGVLDIMNHAYPKPCKFREEVPMIAYNNKGLLQTRFGYQRFFYDIQHFSRRDGRWIRGKDWEACIALRVQNLAHSMFKLVGLEMEREGLNERYGRINEIHDEIMFDCPKHLEEEARHVIAAKMSAPFPMLPLPSGKLFHVNVELKRGPNWAEMEKV